jgi:hypothetical protein
MRAYAPRAFGLVAVVTERLIPLRKPSGAEVSSKLLATLVLAVILLPTTIDVVNGEEPWLRFTTTDAR